MSGQSVGATAATQQIWKGKFLSSLFSLKQIHYEAPYQAFARWDGVWCISPFYTGEIGEDSIIIIIIIIIV